jgi:hypothetical protein
MYISLRISPPIPTLQKNQKLDLQIIEGMSSSQTYEPRNVEADIAYWKERKDGSLPADAEEGAKIMMAGKDMDATKLTVYDLRNIEDKFTLDKNGFKSSTRTTLRFTPKTTTRLRPRSFRFGRNLSKNCTKYSPNAPRHSD